MKQDGRLAGRARRAHSPGEEGGRGQPRAGPHWPPWRRAGAKDAGDSVPVPPAPAATATATASAVLLATAHAARRGLIATGPTGGEHGELLLQVRGTAVRAGRALPPGGAHQDFAVTLALRAMKFVDRHGRRIAGTRRTSSGARALCACRGLGASHSRVALPHGKRGLRPLAGDAGPLAEEPGGGWLGRLAQRLARLVYTE